MLVPEPPQLRCLILMLAPRRTNLMPEEFIVATSCVSFSRSTISHETFGTEHGYKENSE